VNIIPDRDKAIFYEKRDIAQIVTDVVNLEDINFTVPEVQTLLDGITVGGHKIQDELITINQINAWHFLFRKLETKHFVCDLNFLLNLHAIVAKEEALTWGEFRSGAVTISGTDFMPPNAIKPPSIINYLLEDTQNQQDIYDRAIFLFAEIARTKFFYDGNKRTARMMMSGILLDHGYPMINVPAKNKTQFNQLMIEYYETHNISKLSIFLKNCINPHILQEFVAIK
jgi:Fic family protein